MQSKTERVIESLFAETPASRELEPRLRDLSAKHARRLVADRFVQGGLDERKLRVVRDALACLGVGRELTRLEGVLRDKARPLAERAVAYLLVATSYETEQAEIDLSLQKDDLREVWDSAVLADMRRVRDEPELMNTITNVLEDAQEKKQWAPTLEQLERLRASCTMPAALVYGQALFQVDLEMPHLERLVEIVLAEDCDETVDLFADMLMNSDEKPAREIVREPWMRARARRARPLQGEAWVSSPDAEGARLVIAVLLDSEDSIGDFDSTLVSMTLRDSEVTASSMEPRVLIERVGDLLADLEDENGIELETTKLSDAAALVLSARAADEHAPALRMLEVYGGLASDPKPPRSDGLASDA